MADEAVFPLWCYVDRLEQSGKITGFEARRWKHEIFSVMLERGLEPDGLIGVAEEPVEVVDSHRFRPAQLGGALQTPWVVAALNGSIRP